MNKLLWFYFALLFLHVCTGLSSAQDEYHNFNNSDLIFKEDKGLFIKPLYLSSNSALRSRQLAKKYLNAENLYSLTIQADEEMELVWIFTEQNNDTFITENGMEHQVFLPQNSYELITLFSISDNHNKFFYKKDINVSSDTTLVIKSAETNKTTIFEFLREDSSPLIINSLLIIFNHPNDYMGLSLGLVKGDSTAYVFQYNDLPDNFINSWLIKGKQIDNRGNLYLINNSLIESESDTIFTNNPNNYSFADIYYHFADSLETTYPRAQVGTNAPSLHWYQTDPDYYLPLHIRIYQDTSADFSLYESRFSQKVTILGTPWKDMKTSEMRLGDDKVLGYLTPDQYDEPFIISENNEVHLGITPTYWYGRFSNDEDTIKIRSPFGQIQGHQLFLSQTNDVLRQLPITVQIYSEDELLYEDESLTAAFGIWIQYGFEESDITYQLESDKYDMVFINNHSEVAKHPASTVVKTSFDLRLTDRNPPYLLGFQILSDSKICNVLNPNGQNIIRFITKDDQELTTAKLYYSPYEDTLWTELLLEVNTPYYQTDVPNIGDGYYSVKILLSDTMQNSIETVMSPAFHVGEVTAISETKAAPSWDAIQLFPAYPNPFNSEVQFKYVVPINYSNEIDISIFNILGQRICTLLDDNAKHGIHQMEWNGRDSNNYQVSSGVYFIQLKADNLQIYQKILLIK